MKKYDYIRLPATDTWGLLMPKDACLLAAHDFIRPEDIWELPLISSLTDYGQQRIFRLAEKDYDKLNIVATYNLVYNASLYGGGGTGIRPVSGQAGEHLRRQPPVFPAVETKDGRPS